MAQTMDIYARVSKVAGREGDSYQSPTTQVAAGKRWAKANGITVGKVVIEEDVSGKIKASDRKLETLIKRCESGESAGIIVQWVDRLTRGRLGDAASIWERLQAANARFVATDDGLDSRSESAELFFAIRVALAREEWKRYAKNWEQAKDNARARGVEVVKTIIGTKRVDGKLVPNDHAATIALLFAEKMAGKSYRDLSLLAKSMGLSITTTGVRSVLANERYVGLGIVDAATFRKVQTTKSRRPATGSGKDTLLQGIARCGSCGKALVVIRNSKGGAVYYCKGDSLSGCDHRACVNQAKLDAEVEAIFLAAIESDSPLNEAVGASEAVNEATALRMEKEEALNALLSDSEAFSGVSAKSMAQLIKTHEDALEMAQTLENQARDAAEAVSFDGNLLSQWATLTTTDKRQLLKSALDRVSVTGTNRKGWTTQVIAVGNVLIGADTEAVLAP